MGTRVIFFFPETTTDTRLKVFLCQTQRWPSSAPFAAGFNRTESHFFLQHPVCPGSGMSVLGLVTVCV